MDLSLARSLATSNLQWRQSSTRKIASKSTLIARNHNHLASSSYRCWSIGRNETDHVEPDDTRSNRPMHTVKKGDVREFLGRTIVIFAVTLQSFTAVDLDSIR
jgi:hypothetical protein